MKSRNVLIVLLLVITIALAVGLAFLGNKYVEVRNNLNDVTEKQEELQNGSREEQENNDVEEPKIEEKFSNVIFDPEKIVNKGEDTYTEDFSVGGYRGDLTISGTRVRHVVHINSNPDMIPFDYEASENITDIAMANVYPGVAEEYAFVTQTGKLYYAKNTSGFEDVEKIIEVTQVANIVKVGVGVYNSDYSDLTARKGSVLIAIDKDGNCYDVRKLIEEIK